jgi:hypothetical protein
MKLLPIFEAVIQPDDFDHYIERLNNGQGRNVDELNQMFDEHVQFITVPQFLEMCPDAKLPENIHYMIQQHGGLGAGTVVGDKIYMICNPRELNRSLSNHNRGHIIQFLRLALRHENIHVHQIRKSGGRNADVQQASTPEEMRDYLANPQEIMAHAQSIVDMLHLQDMSNEDIIYLLRKGRIQNPYLQQYIQTFGSNSPVVKQLKKYIYQYLTN